MIRTLTSNTRNIIGHQIASLLAVTKNIGDILCECQTSAVGIIASKNHKIIIVIIRTHNGNVMSPAGSARLVTGPYVGDYKHLPSTGLIATVTTLLRLFTFSASRYFSNVYEVSCRILILDIGHDCIESESDVSIIEYKISKAFHNNE